MAYQTGVASDRWDLLNKLKTFAQGLGWVAYKEGSATVGSHIYLGLRDASSRGYWAFICPNDHADPFLDITCNTGFDDGQDGYNQPGGHTGYGTRTNRMTGPFLSYDFFGSADYLHVVVQVSAGRFRHFGIGLVANQTLLSDGQYAYGTVYGVSSNNTAVQSECPTEECRLPFGADGGSDSYFSYNTSWTGYIGRASVLRVAGELYYFGSQGINASFAGKFGMGPGDGHLYGSSSRTPWYLTLYCSRSQFGQLVNLTPFNLMVLFADNGYRMIGHVQDMAVTRMAGISAREILSISGEQWMLVPASQYKSTSGAAAAEQESSWDLGYAYKVET